ncbi:MULTISPECIES: P-type ATPase [Rhizobium]|uniref:P-type ATPase n=1 Tax=Rhizobium TaxID=379 RepID=UPI001FDF689C|nr:hypothetical protein [Rhizobium leguminosarum]
MKIKARLPDISSYQGLNHAAQIPCGKAAAALRISNSRARSLSAMECSKPLQQPTLCRAIFSCWNLARAPAHLTLFARDDLRCDESLLTGESVPVRKFANDSGSTQVFAGTMIIRGRGRVSATGSATQLGRIADSISERSRSRPPLLIRLEYFWRNIVYSVAVATVLLVAAGLARGRSGSPQPTAVAKCRTDELTLVNVATDPKGMVSW